MRIAELKFANFRRFRDVKIDINRALVVFIGRNNSGKSTILEALGILLNAHGGYGGVYLNKNDQTGTATIEATLSLNKNEWVSTIKLVAHEFPKIEIPLESLSQQLDNSQILVEWRSSYVDGKQTSTQRTFKLLNEQIITNLDSQLQNVIRRAVANLTNQNLAVMFGVVLLTADRRIQRDEGFIPFNSFIQRPDRHELIRNSLYHLKRKDRAKYDQLTRRITSVFQDLGDIDVIHNEDTGNVDLSVTEADKPTDFTEMGGGTKSLVIVLTRLLAPNTSVALLDEPDVNMHPGLVRDLVLFLRQISSDTQIILSSHHETFVNELDRGEIYHVLISGKLTSAVEKLETPTSAVRLLEDIGITPTNFLRAEASTSRAIVLGEGPTDWIYIKEFARRLGKYEELMRAMPVYLPLGGKRMIDSRVLDGMHGSPVPFVLVRDRDEYNNQAIEEMVAKIGERRVHFLNRREIENYCVDAKAILHLLKARAQTKDASTSNVVNALSAEDIRQKLLQLAAKYKRKVLLMRFIQSFPPLRLLSSEELATFIERNTQRNDEDTINDLCGNILDKFSALNRTELNSVLLKESTALNTDWNDNTALKMCPGKDLFKEINKWTSADYGISFSPKEIIDYLDEIDQDIVSLVQKILDVGASS
jgi:predicted ATP-dependent endonuclease of OLD family